MPRGHKIDRFATANTMLKDKRSFIGMDGHKYLYGADMSWQRHRLCERANHTCELCGLPTGWDEGHVHHKVERSAGGGDDLENLSWLCYPCHSGHHAHRPKLASR